MASEERLSQQPSLKMQCLVREEVGTSEYRRTVIITVIVNVPDFGRDVEDGAVLALFEGFLGREGNCAGQMISVDRAFRNSLGRNTYSRA